METKNIRIVILGDVNTGKSSIKSYFGGSDDSSNYDVSSWMLSIPGANLRFIEIPGWAKGLEPKIEAQCADIVFAFFAHDDPASFRNLGVWLEAYRPYFGSAPVFVLGNKHDLDVNISHAEIHKFICKNRISFYSDLSCKTGEGFDELITHFMTCILGVHVTKETISRVQNPRIVTCY